MIEFSTRNSIQVHFDEKIEDAKDTMIWYVLVWFGLFLRIGSVSSSSNETCWPTANNLTCVLNDLLLGYNKQLRPNHTGDPIHVQVYMMIITLGKMWIKSLLFDTCIF